MNLDRPAVHVLVVLAVAALAIANPLYLYQHPGSEYTIEVKHTVDADYQPPQDELANDMEYDLPYVDGETENVTFDELDAREQAIFLQALEGDRQKFKQRGHDFETFDLPGRALSGGHPTVYGVTYEGKEYVVVIHAGFGSLLSEGLHSVMMRVIGGGLLLLGLTYALGWRDRDETKWAALGSVVLYAVLVYTWLDVYPIEEWGGLASYGSTLGGLAYLLLIPTLYGLVLVSGVRAGLARIRA